MRQITVVTLILALATSHAFAQTTSKPRPGKHLVEIGCVPPKPSNECTIAVGFFASGMKFTHGALSVLFERYGKVDGMDRKKWDRYFDLDLCLRAIGDSGPQAVAQYIAAHPAALEDAEDLVIANAFSERFPWPCR